MKGVMVESAFEALGMRLKRGTGLAARAKDGSAFEAGRAAGDRASFGRPVNGGAGVEQIAGK